jgi:hypothetical protein
LLAYLDRTDRWHDPCRAAFAGLRLPLVTSTAVLTELFHLVGDNRREVQTAWEFVRSGALTVASLADRDVLDLEELMRRYHDRPMDLADATLVAAAEALGLTRVFTLDRDFQVYRWRGKRKFEVIP